MSGGNEFILNSVSYESASVMPKRMAVITPCLQITSVKKLVLIGFLLVDGHELIPSFRTVIETGTNEIRLKPFRIIRPTPPPSSYKVELHLSINGFEYITDSQEITIELK